MGVPDVPSVLKLLCMGKYPVLVKVCPMYTVYSTFCWLCEGVYPLSVLVQLR